MASVPAGKDSVLVADDDEGVRALVGGILRSAGFDVVEASAGDEAVAVARRRRLCLVILDVNMPGGSGYEVCHTLRADFGSSLPVMFLSGDRTESYDRVAGLLLGADDYMTKPFAPDELLARARALVRRGNAEEQRRSSSLTPRELQVLRLLAGELTQDEIAARLVISPRTVSTHIERILAKLEVRNRAQAVARAYRDRLLELR
jgi:DNA-binding response OmpR family regulator